MKSPIESSPSLVVLLLGLSSVIFVAHAQQPSISISSDPSTGNSRTFLAGQFSISKDVEPLLRALDNNIFSGALQQPLRAGDTVAAMTSADQAWSINKTQTGYPIMAMVKSSDGNFRSLFPAVLRIKIDVKPGAVLHAGRYDIETKRTIKSGDSVPVLFIEGKSLLSVDAVEGTKKADEAQPSFTVFESGTKPDDQRATIEAWRVERDHIK